MMVLACGSINAPMAVLNGSSVLTDMASAVRWGSAVSPGVSLKQARGLAEAARSQLAAGIDPIKER